MPIIISNAFELTVSPEPYWDTIPNLPAGSSYNVKSNHLVDPGSLVTITRAIGLSNGSVYNDSTGVLTYGTTQQSGIYMEADFTLPSSGVSDTQGLVDAVAAANAGGDKRIILADGTYTLGAGFGITVDGVIIESASGNRTACIIEGDAMSGGAAVQQMFTVFGNNFVLRNLTARKCGTHIIQYKGEQAGGITGGTVSNCILQDAYEQILKCTDSESFPNNYATGLIVEDCLIEHTAGVAPQQYNGGIDYHRAKDCIVRRNTFRNIKSPDGTPTEHAIHFWSAAERPLIERNVIINCDRGIGLGLSGQEATVDGIIRNNFIARSIAGGGAGSDFGITLEKAGGTPKVYNNTVWLEDGLTCIDYRWPETTGALITNNLCNGAISSRDSGVATETTNVENAQTSWFVSPSSGDLRLSGTQATVVDQGTTVAEVTDDIDGTARSAPYDIGAEEFSAGQAFVPSDVNGLVLWVNGSNVDTFSHMSFPVVDVAYDQSGNNNTCSKVTDYYLGWQSGITLYGWTTLLPTFGMDRYTDPPDDGFTLYGQALDFANPVVASGEFYLVSVISNTRDTGRRYMWGRDTSNYVRLWQGAEGNSLGMEIANSGETAITGSEAVPHQNGAQIVEIWRDGNDVIKVRVNGNLVGNGTVLSGTLNLTGLGGDVGNIGGSGWDDYAFEHLAANTATTQTDRDNILTFLNNKWLVY